MFNRNMILKQTLFLLTSLLTLSGCMSYQTPEIRAVCQRDDIGNYIIKWETDPLVTGILKLYVSDSPRSFNLAEPVGYANCLDGIMKFITHDNITRKYFLLSFNDKYYHMVAARAFLMDGIRNLRDIGGYQTGDFEQIIEWGKVYRSGKLYPLSYRDSIRMENLGIKTVINLHDEDAPNLNNYPFCKGKAITIPIAIKNQDLINEKLMSGCIRKGDGLLFMQDAYLNFIDEYSDKFGQAMQLFLNKDNYPILINSQLGKDRVGFMTAMLLAALNIPEETIKKDYLASNDYIDISEIADYAHTMDTDAQETITLLLSANETIIDLVFRQIKKKYGSIDKYLTNGLNFSQEDRETLKDILLRQTLSE